MRRRAPGGLVGEDEGRGPDHGGRHGEPLLLPAGELVRPVGRPVRQTEPLEQSWAVVVSTSAQLRREPQLLGGVQVVEQVVGWPLEQVAQVSCP